jgi:hypothetical protein
VKPRENLDFVAEEKNVSPCRNLVTEQLREIAANGTNYEYNKRGGHVNWD